MNDTPDRQTSHIEPPTGPIRGTLLVLWRGFWYVTLVGSLYFAWYCFFVPANGIDWSVDYVSAQRKSASTGKPMMLFFTGKWCVPCRIMKRTVFADEQVKDSVNAAFSPVTIDVDDPSAAEVVGRFGVRGTPVTMVTDPQGNVLQWKDGGMGKAEFLAWIGDGNRSAVPKTP
jgi:thioredoxin 1